MKPVKDLQTSHTPTLILAVLADGPRHGYAIAREIERRSQHALSPGEGSLYPALRTLENEGLVVGAWQPQPSGPARRVYSLTDAGHAELTKRVQAWNKYAHAVGAILGEGHMDNPPENEVLEKYLNRLCMLFYFMPEAEQAEARDEIRQHLLTMIALHEAEGMSKSEAVKVSLENFGDPRKIGEEMMKAWLKKREAEIASTQQKNDATRGKLVQFLQFGCIMGWSWTNVSSHSNSPSFAWASVVIPVAIWGAIMGLLNAVRPTQQLQSPILEAATRTRDQPMRALSENASLWHRFNHSIAKNLRGWALRELDNITAQQSGQKPPTFDLGKLMTRLAVLGVILALPIKGYWITQQFVSLFVVLNSGWVAGEAARRILYRARKAH